MSNGSPAPKLEQLQPLARKAIAESAFFASGGGSSVPVLVDIGRQDVTVEKHLRNSGAAVVVYPVLTWKARDQSGPLAIVDATLLVKVKVNPEIYASGDESSSSATDGEGDTPDIYELCRETSAALCRRTRHNGGEFFKLDTDAGSLSQFDRGIWEYDLLFNKEAVI